MEIKKITEELEIINDINKLSTDELKEKYSSTYVDFESFMNKYANYFGTHQIYQIRAGNEYNKIVDIIKDGTSKFQSETILSNAEIIMNGINITKKRFHISENGNSEDVYQSRVVFLDSIGSLNGKHIPEYSDIVCDIYNAAKRYENKGESSIDDFTYYTNYALKSSKTEEEFYKLMRDYIEKHPMLNLCNEVSYLYFANYMLRNNRSKVDRDFLQDTESIMNASNIMQHIGLVDKKVDLKEYKKVEKNTKSNLKLYYKRKERQEQEIKKLSKSFLNK